MTELNRRNFLVGAAALGLLTACGRAEPAAQAGGGAWEFTDDRGKKITLGHRPVRIVAQSGAAAALWDLGVRPVGVFGPQRRKDGSNDPQIGSVDLGTVRSIGSEYGEFGVEKLAALKPDLLISGMYKPNELWYVTEEVRPKVEAITPTLGISQRGRTALQVIERFGELGRSLGADLGTAAAAKAAFETASRELSEAAKANQGLRVMAYSATTELFYAALATDHPDLAYFRGLGLQFGGKTGDGATYFENLSWEQAAKYPADLILYDARTQALTADALKTHPTWTALPAVQAGQIAKWHPETPFSHAQYVPVLQELTAAVKKARRL